ncbi:MAG: membrane protein insertase YidC, partial [Pseudomonas formosensis]|nr:membrane protein insertase YidC [Halopseudomonas formosensis]
MNMQRNILIAALAVITYLMILQWNKDYVDPVAEAAVNGSSPQAQTADVPALPGTPADAVTENGDVPLAVEADGSDIPALQPTTTASTASGLISIET